jgi:hypothetical protein
MSAQANLLSHECGDHAANPLEFFAELDFQMVDGKNVPRITLVRLCTGTSKRFADRSFFRSSSSRRLATLTALLKGSNDVPLEKLVSFEQPLRSHEIEEGGLW